MSPTSQQCRSRPVSVTTSLWLLATLAARCSSRHTPLRPEPRPASRVLRPISSLPLARARAICARIMGAIRDHTTRTPTHMYRCVACKCGPRFPRPSEKGNCNSRRRQSALDTRLSVWSAPIAALVSVTPTARMGSPSLAPARTAALPTHGPRLCPHMSCSPNMLYMSPPTQPCAVRVRLEQWLDVYRVEPLPPRTQVWGSGCCCCCSLQ